MKKKDKETHSSLYTIYKLENREVVNTQRERERKERNNQSSKSVTRKSNDFD